MLRLVTRLSILPFALFVMVAAACGGERTVAGPNGGNGSGPEFATLTVEVGLEGPGAGLGSALGWETGVPEATVHVLRNGTATWREGRSGGDGRAVFERLLPGLYRVYATRRLSSPEAQTAGEPVRAFGDGGTFTIPAGSSTVSMRLVADVPAGLVISEVSPRIVLLAGTSYVDAMYFELYNSSAEVQYIDALLFGSAYDLGFRDWDHTPCSASEPARDDPLGLNTTQVIQFPGQGSEYPIQAGETKLVAIAAIDHSAVDPGLLDLSGADFELGGRANADNPAVPNMMEVGLTPFMLSGTTPPLLADGRVLFLARPVDVSSLPISFRDHTGHSYVRIPGADLLDVASFGVLWPDKDLDHPPCVPMAPKTVERYEIAVRELGTGGEQVNLSYQRRPLRTENGRTILQDTNTTAADFIQAAHTPGTIPP